MEGVDNTDKSNLPCWPTTFHTDGLWQDQPPWRIISIVVIVPFIFKILWSEIKSRHSSKHSSHESRLPVRTGLPGTAVNWGREDNLPRLTPSLKMSLPGIESNDVRLLIADVAIMFSVPATDWLLPRICHVNGALTFAHESKAWALLQWLSQSVFCLNDAVNIPL